MTNRHRNDDLEENLSEIYIGDEHDGDEASRDTYIIDPTYDSIEQVPHDPLVKKTRQQKMLYASGIIFIILVSVFALLLGITLTQDSSLLGDKCLNAPSLQIGDAPIHFSTNGASKNNDGDVEVCGLDLETGPGVWFRVQGTGQSVKITKDDEIPFSNQISVYRGHCGALKCVTGDNLKGIALWNTKVGENYYVRVNGVNGADGRFSVILEEVMDWSGSVATNDMCDDSIAIVADGSFSYGTTETATLDREGAGSCYKDSNAGLGVWYDVIGSGSALLATANTNDVKLAIFKGDCGNLECVGASDLVTGVVSSVQWQTEGSERYKILVHSVGDGEGLPFEVSVATTTYGGEFVINDFCKGAVGPVASDGSLLVGSTEHATLDREGSGSCYPDTLTGNGVWYTVRGTGEIMNIFAIADSPIEPLVTVFQGSCGRLECLEGTRHWIDEDGHSILSWTTAVDEIYYFLVRGTGDEAGEFQIVLETTAIPTKAPVALAEVQFVLQGPINDFCDSASIAATGSEIQDSTLTATTYMDDIGQCHSQDGAGPGIWYRVTGTGVPLQATITDNSTLDASIAVYSGDCEALFCVADVRGDKQPKRSFTWDTHENKVYYILVQGESGQRGDFKLIFSEASLDALVPANDLCQGAIGPVAPNGTIVTGSTEYATIDMDEAGSCFDASSNVTGNMTGAGIWYTVQGTGSQLDLFSKGNKDFALSVAIFEGFGCDSLQCVTASHASANKAGILTWRSIKNVPYYILVSGVEDTAGVFEFGIVPGKAQPEEAGQEVEIDIFSNNDKCVDAKSLLVSEDVALTGTTAEAMQIEAVRAGTCSSSVGDSPGLWYTFVGTGSKMHASTRSLSSESVASISVFAGSCDTLSCVDETGEETTGSIYWDSKNGTHYQVFIHSPQNKTGSFELKLQSSATTGPTNDLCDASLPSVPTNGIPIQGSNAGATDDMPAGNCHGQSDVGPGVWFKVTGSGNVMTLAENTALSMDAIISIYEGNCDSLVCLNGIGRPIQQSGPSTSWGTVAGKEYYVLIQSSTAETGIFEFGIDEYVKGVPAQTGAPASTSPPTQTGSLPSASSSNMCSEAIGPLEKSSAEIGTFGEATTNAVGVCGTADTETPGLWFTIQGTGKGMQLSACDPETGPRSVAVFRDGCDNLKCFAGSSNTCAGGGPLIFNTEKDELYHLLVTGEGGEEGFYTLLHDEIEWFPSNCKDSSTSYLSQLYNLHDLFLSLGNTEQSGPLPGKNWLSGCDVCNNWGGIECNDDSVVNKIHLGTYILI